MASASHLVKFSTGGVEDCPRASGAVGVGSGWELSGASHFAEASADLDAQRLGDLKLGYDDPSHSLWVDQSRLLKTFFGLCIV